MEKRTSNILNLCLVYWEWCGNHVHAHVYLYKDINLSGSILRLRQSILESILRLLSLQMRKRHYLAVGMMRPISMLWTPRNLKLLHCCGVASQTEPFSCAYCSPLLIYFLPKCYVTSASLCGVALDMLIPVTVVFQEFSWIGRMTKLHRICRPWLLLLERQINW